MKVPEVRKPCLMSVATKKKVDHDFTGDPMQHVCGKLGTCIHTQGRFVAHML